MCMCVTMLIIVSILILYNMYYEYHSITVIVIRGIYTILCTSMISEPILVLLYIIEYYISNAQTKKIRHIRSI